MPVRVSPADGTQRWVSGLQGATTRITTGVDSVTTAPGVKAAAQKAKWIAKLASPAVQNKWEANVKAVDLATWQQLMKNVGIPRIAQGAQEKQSKYEAFATKFYPFLANVVRQIDNLPNQTFADSVNRVTQYMTMVHAYGQQNG